MLSLMSGLVAYIPLDNYSDVPVTDGVNDMIAPHDLLLGSSGANVVVAGPGNQPALSFPGGINDVFVGFNAASKFLFEDSTYTLAGWAWLDSTAALRVIFGKSWDVAGDKDYQLYFDSASNRYKFRVYRAVDSAVDATADNFGAVPINTWNFVHGYHSAEDDEVGIRVNLGAFDTTATGGALQSDSEAEFEVGTRNQGDSRWLGRLMGLGVWSRKLTGVENAWLYNNGRGITWPFGDGRGTVMNFNRRLRRRRIA